jgi:site-specific recombinase XerD
MTVFEAYQKFIIDKRIENCTDSSIQNYKNMVLYFVRFVGPDTEASLIQDIDYVKRYILNLQEKKVSGKTIHTYVKHLKVFYRWLVNNGHIEYNAVSDLKIRYEKKIPQIFDIKEITELMTIDNLRDRTMVLIVLDCGLRKRELTNLMVVDIKPDRIFIRNGKGRKDRIVPLSSAVYEMIQEYIATRPENTEYLFQHYDNSARLGYVGVRQVFRRLQDTTGIKRLAPHLCRHTYGTYYIHNGGDIKVLQLLLGHSEVDTTEMYVHLSNLLDVGKYSKHSIINVLTRKRDG